MGGFEATGLSKRVLFSLQDCFKLVLGKSDGRPSILSMVIRQIPTHCGGCGGRGHQAARHYTSTKPQWTRI